MFYKIKVEVKSKKPEVIRLAEDKLKVKVKAPARQGLANKEMKMLVANYLKIDKSKIRLIKGWQSTSKIIEILSHTT